VAAQAGPGEAAGVLQLREWRQPVAHRLNQPVKPRARASAAYPAAAAAQRPAPAFHRFETPAYRAMARACEGQLRICIGGNSTPAPRRPGQRFNSHTPRGPAQ